MRARTARGPATRILVIDRDRELAARLRHHAVAGGAVVKSCPDTGRAEAHLAAGHWDALVAGPSLMHRGGLRRLASLHVRHPSVAKILALAERPRADLAEIVAAGASDLFPLHADDDNLRRTLARATRITRGRLGLLTSPAGGGRGRTVMVASASGGCGKTFLATNAAEFLARTTGEPVVLVDLDLQFGEVSTALRLRPEVTITDALAAEAEGFDLADVLDEFLLDHPDGFKVLAAPRLPAEADSVTPGDVTRILEVLRAHRAWVVIDTHEGLSDLFVAALDVTDHLFAVATPDRPSLVNLGRYLGALERLGMAAEGISVVLNKSETGSGLDPLDMAVELGRRFEAIVPYSREVARSVNLGVPVVAGKPKSPVAQLLTTALAALLPGRPRPEPVPVPAPPAPTPARQPRPGPAEPVGVIALPPPPPVPDTPAAEAPPGSDEPVEIDLSDPPRRPCPAAGRAQGGRCRHARAPAWRGQGPPRSKSPHSSSITSHPTPSNDPAGLSGKPRTPPTRKERNLRSSRISQRRIHGAAPILSDAHPRPGRLRDRSRCRPRVLHGIG